ncbi:MAG: hypothetical protein HYY16_18745 [Planctomycetes bacterium]|nr:hypothetical protein [Planctomycetota bacterium]
MRAWLMVVGVLLAAASAEADEGEEILRRAIEVYRPLPSYQAKLLVTTWLADAEIRQEGLLKVKGVKIIFTLRDADSRRWAALFHDDGKHQYQLDWSRKKILRRKADGRSLQEAVGFFPGFDRFEASSARLEGSFFEDGKEFHRVVVELKGATEKSAFRCVRLEISDDAAPIRRMEFMSPRRRTVLSVVFQKQELDPKLEDEEFAWTKPVGLEDVAVEDVESDPK